MEFSLDESSIMLNSINGNGFSLPEGCSWNPKLENGMKTGKVTVRDDKGRLYAILTYLSDKLNGLSVFYENGLPKEKITFIDNVAIGWGCECERGKEARWFIYENGSKKYALSKKEGMDGYWERRRIGEKDVLSCCQYDKDHQITGIGYIFKNNKINKVSLYEKGVEVRSLKKFIESGMRDYDGSDVYYEGEYLDDMQANYPRHGNGREIKNDNCLFDGEWKNNKKNGYGQSFTEEGLARYHGEWKDDLPHGEGMLFNEECDIVYEGEWVCGKICVQGDNWFDYQLNTVVQWNGNCT